MCKKLESLVSIWLKVPVLPVEWDARATSKLCGTMTFFKGCKNKLQSETMQSNCE